MLRTGKSFLYEAPYYAVLPGIVLTLTILSLDTLGRTLAWVLEERHELGEETDTEAEKARS
jgi:ABC-type dipeptide/oligopeptide/nickel transport system permease subunit